MNAVHLSCFQHTLGLAGDRAEREQNVSTQNTEQPKSASQIVAEAHQTIQEITVAQAKEELDGGQVTLLLDVREPAEWEKDYIPGAILAPRGMLEWYADPTTPCAKPELTTKPDARLIVACACGGRSSFRPKR
jgi:rhodanese-related sulfurtransferase